ncbi:LysM peptidoglycan-binding domain-containing protein [Levilactobacillus hammesii]|nr:LysM peptidoglycan-binding domain-containing protein [Levilactobacillus hammesii]
MSTGQRKTKALVGVVGAMGALAAGATITANADSIQVKQGDTVWELSQKLGVSIDDLEAQNSIDSKTDLIFVGQKLQVRSAKTTQNYTVKSGDTLWDLAQQYHLTVAQLQKANHMSGDVLSVGQQLTIPRGSAAASGKVDSGSQTTTTRSATQQSTQKANAVQAQIVAQQQAAASKQQQKQSAAATSSQATTASQSTTKQSTSSSSTSTTRSAATSSSVKDNHTNAGVTSRSGLARTATNSSSTAQSSSVTSSAPSSSTSTSSASSNTTPTTSATTSTSSQSSQSVQSQQRPTRSATPASRVSAQSQSSTAQSSTPSATSTSPSSAVTSSNSQAQKQTGSQNATATTTTKRIRTTTQSAVKKQAAKAAATNNTQTAATSSSSTSSSATATTSSSAKKTTNTAGLTSGSVTGLALKLSSANIPYVWGGSSLSGMDCSGLVAYVYKNAMGISLPHNTVSQEAYVSTHSVGSAKPGDILFWGSKGATYHDAIYLGNNQFVDAPTVGQNVQVHQISKYFMPSFAGTVK